MFTKIINWIKEIYHKMIPYKSIEKAINIQPSISNEMIEGIEKWQLMYNNKSAWLDSKKGIYSLNLASHICSELASDVTLEMQVRIAEPGTDNEETDQTKNIDLNNRANYLNEVIHRELLDVDKLRTHLEHGMSTGGLIIKPYVKNNKIYFDFNPQGEFIPIAFNDDGRISEIAFVDTVTIGDKTYTKIEHHTYDEITQTVTIQNTAYQNYSNTALNGELGTPISLDSIPQWAGLEPETTIANTDRPLYGYYKVAKANNIDTRSPLGISVFSRATDIIERADKQFSRLDWEYCGGEMAIDVDTTATFADSSGNKIIYPEGKERLFRKIDAGSEETYNIFAPGLRDTEYINGLNVYLRKIEDLCELPRGSICQDNSNTDYTNQLHLKLNNQKAYRNICDNQKALQNALEDVIYVTNLYATLYKITPDGDYDVSFEWDDSIITDVQSQLDQKLSLNNIGAISSAEIRAWYLGESEETAKAKVEEIKKDSEKKLPDLFNTTLEQ